MKAKPWRTSVGLMIGLIVGFVAWWDSYDSSKGAFQSLGLIVFCAGMGAFIVDLRNRRKRVGHYDPDTIAENKRGRV